MVIYSEGSPESHRVTFTLLPTFFPSPAGLSFRREQPARALTSSTFPLATVLTLHQPRPAGTAAATATSALGLLLQSSKFKEMVEMTSMVDDLSAPVAPESEMPRHCRFPDDIQTYFECEDSNSNGEGDDHIMFSELNSFVPPLFHCDDF